MKHVVAAAFFVTTLIGPANEVQAQTRAMYERLLVPIVINASVGEVPGAFGSRWVTRLVGYNASNEAIFVDQSFLGCQITCPIRTVPPNSTFALTDFVLRSGTGSFLHVARPHNNSVTFNLRVQDLSRQALTWGTELPVVSESEAFMDTLQLLNIPTDPRFRAAIRIYDFEPAFREDRHVRLKVFGATHQLLAETTVTLVLQGNPDSVPGYAQFVDLVAVFPQLAASETIRVEITPISPGLRFWAFAAITNNETQHVTTITPQ